MNITACTAPLLAARRRVELRDDMIPTTFVRSLSRRRLLLAGGAIAAAGLFPGFSRPTWAAEPTHTLTPGPGRARLVGNAHPETTVWCYDGRVPGPEIRVRQGNRLRIAVNNRLGEETTIHWHGIRVPNAMDGVPHMPVPPIAPARRSPMSSTPWTQALSGTTRTFAATNRSAAASPDRSSSKSTSRSRSIVTSLRC